MKVNHINQLPCESNYPTKTQVLLIESETEILKEILQTYLAQSDNFDTKGSRNLHHQNYFCAELLHLLNNKGNK